MKKNLISIFALAAATMLSSNASANQAAVISAAGDTTLKATLAAAFNDVQNGETVLLLEDINIGSTITINKPNDTITFNMRGKSWNFNDKKESLALGLDLQAGMLTVKGNGAMKDSVGSATFFNVVAGANLIIATGNFTNKGEAAGVKSAGDLTVKTWVNAIEVLGGKAVILDGAHVNSQINITKGAEVSVEGGEIKAINGNGKLTVSAGTIEAVANTGDNLYVGGKVHAIEDGTNTIEGGKFKKLNVMADYTLKGGVYESDTLSNGEKMNSLVAEGYSVKPNEDPTYKFQVSKDLIIITRTGVVFGTIEEALKAAVDGDTVKLKENIELGGNLNVYLNGKVTLDLNGNTWSLSNAKEAQQCGMRVYEGELIVNNGSIAYDAEYGSCTFFDMKDSTKLTLNDVLFFGNNGRIDCNGEMIINGGELRSLTLGDKATALTVNGGKITSQISLASTPEVRCNVVINDGEIENICTMNGKIRGTFVTVNGGEINWLQNGDSTFVKGGTITHINGGLNVISGGKLDSLYYHNCSDTASLAYRSCAYTIQGGMFVDVKYITDGVEREISEDFAPGFELIANTDPETMEEYPWVAKQTATSVEEMSSESKVQDAKVIRNGQLMIIRDGVRYNAQGARL